MKLFTRSSILKNTTVEISSPKFVECPTPKIDYSKKNVLPGLTSDFLTVSLSEENILAERADLSVESIPENKAVLSEAKAEADKIICEAKIKAEEILKLAEQQSEDLRKTTEEQVRNEVIPLARAEGIEQGLLEARQEADKIKQQARDYLELAKKALKNEFDRADQEIIRLCLQISEKVIHSNLNVDPAKLLNIIRNLALMPQEKEGIKIHLSPKDWEWYKNLPDTDKPAYPVIIDESLRTGDCFLECAEGVFDARIDSQLEILQQHLIEVLGHGGLDDFSQKD